MLKLEMPMNMAKKPIIEKCKQETLNSTSLGSNQPCATIYLKMHNLDFDHIIFMNNSYSHI